MVVCVSSGFHDTTVHTEQEKGSVKAQETYILQQKGYWLPYL